MSTNVGMGSCCLSGKLHEGKPTGREDLNTFNVPTYIAEPANKSTAKTVVFLVDSSSPLSPSQPPTPNPTTQSSAGS